jgi:serine/threonine protein kinase
MGLEQGSLLQGRYRIVDILGQGGMGSVYRAIDENLGVEVAVKENLFTTDEYARQFRLEAVILANLRHPNLTRVTDHFVIGDQGQYLVMDYIDGEDLRQRMERIGNIPEEEVVKIGAEICSALSYLHSRKPPVLHRDLKPGNVKITPDGHVFLVDFGLAKVVQSSSQQTTTGARAMTPGYSPPEQYGTARTDPRSDIYSLGATLYAALTGVIPEDGLARVMDNAQLTPIRKRNASVSRRVASAVEKAMEPYPDDRYQTAADFRQALLNSTSRTQQLTGPVLVTPAPSKPRSAQAGAPVSQPVDTGGTRSIRSRRRNMKWLGWLFTFMVVAGAAVAFYFNPDLQNLAASYIPALQTETPTITPSPTLTPPVADVTETEIFTETPAVSDTPSPTATRTKVPTATATFTISPSPTITLTPTVTPLPTVFGGGYGQVAFVSDRTGKPQVWLMSPDGTNLKQLTNEPQGACQPSWSPDGIRLVFITPCTDKRDIYKGAGLFIINVDGTGLTALPFIGEGSFEPTWSPDGKRIAFTVVKTQAGKTYTQVYTVNLSDNSLKSLAGTPDAQARQPAWSPFGSQIVYNVLRSGVSQIWFMTDLGANQKQLVKSGAEKIDFSPIWSPDGQVIYFNQTDASATNPSWLMKIAYVDRESMIASRVDGPPPILDVDFSSDGNWFIYEGVLNGNRDVYLMTARGGDATRITDDPGNDYDPTWRPSGQQVILANTPIVLPTPVTPSPTVPATETPAATSTSTQAAATPTP